MSAQTKTPQAKTAKKPAAKTAPGVLALRKSCSADGVGLSHYILMDEKKA
jgi:modified peptide precursor CbpA